MLSLVITPLPSERGENLNLNCNPSIYVFCHSQNEPESYTEPLHNSI